MVPDKIKAQAKSLIRYLPAALAGVSAGFVNGLLGAAGGILLVTILPRLSLPERLTRLPGDAAEATDQDAARRLTDRRDLLPLALTVMLPVSLLSFGRCLAGGITLPPRLMAALILPAAAGGLLGAWLLGRIPQTRAKQLFAVLVLVSGLRMML